MNKELENCYSIYVLKQRKHVKNKLLVKTQSYIDDCDIRIKQLEFERDNQFKLGI